MSTELGHDFHDHKETAKDMLIKELLITSFAVSRGNQSVHVGLLSAKKDEILSQLDTFPNLKRLIELSDLNLLKERIPQYLPEGFHHPATACEYVELFRKEISRENIKNIVASFERVKTHERVVKTLEALPDTTESPLQEQEKRVIQGLIILNTVMIAAGIIKSIYE